MRMRVETLRGRALDHAVALCKSQYQYGADLLTYSSNWSFGGPIVEEAHITLDFLPDNGYRAYIRGRYNTTGHDIIMDSWTDTILVVAMRCYVASKFGETIEL